MINCKLENYRILFCIDSLNAGGKERQFVEVVTGLVDEKYIKKENIFVLSMSQSTHFETKIKESGVNFIRLLRKFRWDPFIIFQLGKIVKEVKPNIIHSFSSMTSFYLSFIKKAENIIFVDGSIRNALPLNGFNQGSLISRLTFSRADIIIANSYAGIEATKAPKAKSYVLYNGFSLERIRNLIPPNKVKQMLGIGSEKIVGMVARFHNCKDYESFILSAQKILEKRNDVLFITIGKGASLHSIKRLVLKKYRDKILFLGYKEDVESIVNVFDIGVLLTNNNIHREGISNSIVEYMAVGKPVVATDSGGTKEIVDDGINGYLVKHEDVKSISQKIITLLENENLSKNIGKRGREMVCEKFANKVMVENLLNIYQQDSLLSVQSEI